MATEQETLRQALRTPRSAAVAGIAFSVLFAAALVLIHLSVPLDPTDNGDWLRDGSRRDAVRVALALVPFAGIAFLWFIGVVRDRVGEAEDRFFATVFLGSGLLFVAMLFASAAVAAAVAGVAHDHAQTVVTSGAWDLGRRLAHDLLVVYAMRMAGVFMIATSTILLRTRNAPRWLTAGGFAGALLILLTASFLPWVELVFPVWLFVLSVHILRASLARGRADQRGVPRTG